MRFPDKKALPPLLLLPLLVLSCARSSTKAEFSPLPGHIRRVAVMELVPALNSNEAPRPFRSPFTGAVFMAEPVSRDVTQKMTSLLYRGLVEKKGAGDIIFIPPGQTRGVRAAILSRLRSAKEGRVSQVSTDVAREVGRALGAQAVLGGIVYRWRERVGGPYGAERGASVGYELFLIDVDTGRLLWKWRFDKTQLPLTENLFDAETFLGAGGKWMTALELASLGLEKFFNQFLLWCEK